MKRIFYVIVLGIFLSGLSGCTLFHKSNKLSRPAERPNLSLRKARVAVLDFETKTPKATADVCVGLREMLVAALTKSGRFLVVDQQALSEPDKKKGGNKKLGLVIAVAVLEFEPFSSGGRAGVGGGGSPASGAFGGLLGEPLNKTHIVLDMRIIKKPTSRVLSYKKIQAQASDSGQKSKDRFLEDLSLAGALSDYNNTPMGKTIRLCILEGVRYIKEVMPGRYYRY